jgi:hypothetical protein
MYCERAGIGRERHCPKGERGRTSRRAQGQRGSQGSDSSEGGQTTCVYLVLRPWLLAGQLRIAPGARSTRLSTADLRGLL